MKKLEQTPNNTNPYVCFDSSSGVYEISGHSYPEDASEIFDPIFEWLDENLIKIKGTIELNIKPDYFNSASSRYLLRMFKDLEVHFKAGKDVSIIWTFADEEVENDGIVFSQLVELPFTFIDES